MFDRYVLFGLVHFLLSGFILKLFSIYLPLIITSKYTYIAHVTLFFIVTRLTFGLTKKKFLNEKVYPTNKAVLITGCDSGFGNAFAKRLYSKGFLVFACCLDENSDGAQELKKYGPDRLKVLQLDVTRDESVENAVEFVKENLGSSQLWAVVNNAGIFKGFSIEFTRLEQFTANYEVNALGVVRVTKAFIPLLREFKGRVVNVASLAGRLPIAHMTPYTMSKYAAVAFTECLRIEMFQSGVKVISIEPEAFKTPMTNVNNYDPEYRETKSSDGNAKDTYTETCLKNVRNFFLIFSSICSPKVNKVIDALEMAVCAKYPDAVYRPTRNILFSFCCSIAMAMPTFMTAIMFYFLFNVFVILKSIFR